MAGIVFAKNAEIQRQRRRLNRWVIIAKNAERLKMIINFIHIEMVIKLKCVKIAYVCM
jgi:hypothetical protein